MAIKKDVERQVVEVGDAAVEAALSPNLNQGRGKDLYGKIERARKMTPSQRKKAERDAARSKVTYDIPAELIKRVEMMARDVYRCPPSHLAALLIRAGLKAVEEGRLNVYDHQIPSRVPRFDWFLDLTEDGKK